MPTSISGSLEKMKVIGYSDSAMKNEVGRTNVYINPEKYTRAYTICYNDTTAQGASGGSPDFNKSLSDKLEFELIFDGTGVVPSPKAGVPRADGIKNQVDAFLDVVEKYDGKTHSPNFVWLFWGDLDFKCRMETFQITYTLFKPSGAPLRARAKTAFIGYSDPKTLAKEANTSSPDMTHVLTVKSSNSLPLMCHDVYGSSVYYPQVAKANQLDNFRDIQVGTQLVFPPLSGEQE